MNYTKEQIEKMADEYANQFMDGRDHFYGFKAGFEKALSLFAVSGQSEQFVCGANRVMGEKRCERQCGQCEELYPQTNCR